MADLPEARRRRGYLDWMRGLAVLIMIEAHLLDSWTGLPDRETPLFSWAMILGGLGAPLFLFLAGVAVPMSAGSKFRRSSDARASSRAVLRRGLEVFGLAFLFRIQAWVLGWSSPKALLKVDILNIMGPSIMAAAAMWGAVSTKARRYIVFVAATAATAFLTPVIRALPWVRALPDPIEAYIRPVPGLTNFVFFPWMAFVFAGAIIGLMLDDVRARADETRVNVRLGAAGLVLAGVSFACSYLPPPFAQSYFWTTSPAFFFMRVGLMTATIALAYAWESRAGGLEKFSPIRQLGRTSLFIYWIHVEMVYGLISLPLHKALTLPQASLALLAFIAFMLACSLGKERVVAWWKGR